MRSRFPKQWVAYKGYRCRTKTHPKHPITMTITKTDWGINVAELDYKKRQEEFASLCASVKEKVSLDELVGGEFRTTIARRPASSPAARQQQLPTKAREIPRAGPIAPVARMMLVAQMLLLAPSSGSGSGSGNGIKRKSDAAELPAPSKAKKSVEIVNLTEDDD